jgi:predicted TPR repeat methyltransferase
MDSSRDEKELSLEEALALAVSQHRQGNLDPAEAVYRAILEAVPDHPDALHFLGVLHHQKGRSGEGIQLIRRAVELAPDAAGMHLNLGNVYRETGEYEAAEECYRRVIELMPDSADAWSNLGSALRASGRLDEATEAFEEAHRLDPDHADALKNMGNALVDQGRFDEAAIAYRKTLAIVPDYAEALENLGNALYVAGRTEEAVEIFELWLARDPGNPVARHMLSACTGMEVPERASDGYVETIFDGFADSFDEKLKGLRYRAPELIADAIAKESATDLDILDAGCGTGLCGPHLKPMARRLVGVDLSSSMLEKAAVRGHYDELVKAELTEYLEGSADGFDLIVSADTLVYFGDLGPVLAASASALRPGGRLAFTLERDESDDGSEDFRLSPHGRYAHSEDYVRRTLGGAGFTAVSCAPAHLRVERGKPVEGLLVTARLPG